MRMRIAANGVEQTVSFRRAFHIFFFDSGFP